MKASNMAPFIGRIGHLNKQVKRLEQQLDEAPKAFMEIIEGRDETIKELRNPDWKAFIALCHHWLEKYPEDIFDGSSGDAGPVFVTTLREALRTLEK